MSNGSGIRYELRDLIKKQYRLGTSKRAERHLQNTHNPRGIYSYRTFKDYLDKVDRFGRYMQAEHPEIRHAVNAKEYVKEYLEAHREKGHTEPTITSYRSALAKAYEVDSRTFGVDCVRSRDAIIRGRGETTGRDTGHFSLEKNRDIVDFCRATGARANTDLGRAENAHCKDLYERDGHLYLHIERGKGGLKREVYIPDRYADRVREIVDAARAERGEDGRIFERVPQRLASHALRREYAREFYNDLKADPSLRDELRQVYDIHDNLQYTSNHGEIRQYQSDTIALRGAAAGEEYSREVCAIVSHSLGHGDNRASTVINNYLRGR